MDLISRKAAVSRISDLLILELKGERIPTFNEVYKAIGDVPSVDSVPLDKLCEWLAGYAEPPLDALTICDNPFEAWKMTLTKWMEEQDADRE